MSISWDDDVIEQERLHERVARRLARDIVAGRLREGDIVPPAEVIAKKFAVSRTVGREVLQALSSAGLIDVKHGRKSTVTAAKDWRFLEDLVQHAISREQLAGSLAADLYEVRRLVEIAATEMCAVRASDEQLDQIVQMAQRMHDDAADKDDEPLDVRGRVTDDLAFHGAIAEGSGNLVLTRLVADIRRELVPTWAVDQLDASEVRDVHDAHLEIAKALRNRDVVGARREMARHLDWSVGTTLRRALSDEQLDEVDHRWKPDWPTTKKPRKR
ncbi:FadR/GntR family transcriptional regulator [Mycolicibacterium nivoides]|jgi:DNA-binding FadR family transcriptional regulator|nr:FCD domain-containing protein [Mycolicibacterium nivoides]MBN3512012.1 FadR family transcriptional regulator [Mycolicibacterium septicum]QRY47385.1 FadR family transcriptional regulator [Mycolicibacterium boenickei]SEP61013.1 DNA-binding transcriptional regulator, FadR family [Mycobacterium sp. 88mf]SFF05671.1 DNA-binding transcriptional regulator, FadR family [Mycobacterium sp. 455mf]